MGELDPLLIDFLKLDGSNADQNIDIGAWDFITTGSVSGVNITSGADPGHTHTGASLSGIDISADTNLTVTSPITLTDDDLGFTDTAFVLIDGSHALTSDWDVGAYVLTGLNYISDVATGTSPYACTSTTVNTNLNADMLDGKHVGTSGNTVPLLDGVNDWSGVQEFQTNVKLQFRDSGIFIHSPTDGVMLIEADSVVTIGVAGDTTLGDGTLRLLRPDTTLKIDLGSATYKFNDAFIGNDLQVGNDATITGNCDVGGDMVAVGKVIGEAYYRKLTPADSAQVHDYCNLRITDITGDKFYMYYTPYDFGFMIEVPKGYKATKVKVNGEDSASTVTVYENDLTDGTTATNRGSGTVNTEVDITDISYSDTNYVTIGVNQGANTTDEIFGGYVYMEPDV